MIFLSRLVSQSIAVVAPINLKAARNMMYEISDVIYVPRTAGSNNIFLKEISVEERALASGAFTDGFFVANTNLTVPTSFHYTEPVKTKFMSLVAEATTVFDGYLIISGKLVKASKADLIWEWFRKGR